MFDIGGVTDFDREFGDRGRCGEGSRDKKEADRRDQAKKPKLLAICSRSPPASSPQSYRCHRANRQGFVGLGRLTGIDVLVGGGTSNTAGVCALAPHDETGGDRHSRPVPRRYSPPRLSPGFADRRSPASPATSLRLALARSSKTQPARPLPPPPIRIFVRCCLRLLPSVPGSPFPFQLLPAGSSPVLLGTPIHPRAACPGSFSTPAADHARTTSDFSFYVVCVWSAAVVRLHPNRHAARGWIARPRISPRSRPPPIRSLAGPPADLLAAVAPPRCGSQGRFAPDPRRGLTAAARGALVWVGRRSR